MACYFSAMHSPEHRAVERQRFLYEQVGNLMRAQSWDMLQSLMLIAFTVFSLTLAIGGIAQMARIVTVISGLNISLPGYLGGKTLFNASSTIPYPEFVGVLQRVPLFGVRDAATAAFVVTFVIFVLRLWQGYRLLKNLRRVRATVRELDKELSALRHEKCVTD